MTLVRPLREPTLPTRELMSPHQDQPPRVLLSRRRSTPRDSTLPERRSSHQGNFLARAHELRGSHDRPANAARGEAGAERDAILEESQGAVASVESDAHSVTDDERPRALRVGALQAAAPEAAVVGADVPAVATLAVATLLDVKIFACDSTQMLKISLCDSDVERERLIRSRAGRERHLPFVHACRHRLRCGC